MNNIMRFGVSIDEKLLENSFERSASAALPDHASLKAASLFANSASITPYKITEHFIRENKEAVTSSHVCP
ncbi:MAG: hypothetical protein GY754_37730 [bacterium]|nr:hypothetical protein [bacterium]